MSYVNRVYCSEVQQAGNVRVVLGEDVTFKSFGQTDRSATTAKSSGTGADVESLTQMPLFRQLAGTANIEIYIIAGEGMFTGNRTSGQDNTSGYILLTFSGKGCSVRMSRNEAVK